MKVVASVTLALVSLVTLPEAHQFVPCDRRGARFGPPFHHSFVVPPRPWYFPARPVPPYKPFQPYREQLASSGSVIGFSVDANAAVTPELLPVQANVLPQVEALPAQTDSSTNGSLADLQAANEVPIAPATPEPATMLVVIPPLNVPPETVVAAPESGTTHHPSMRSGAPVSDVNTATVATAVLAASLLAKVFIGLE